MPKQLIIDVAELEKLSKSGKIDLKTLFKTGKEFDEKKIMKKQKNLCPAAVKLTPKDKVNTFILEGKDVYGMKVDGKDEYYGACSRTEYITKDTEPGENKCGFCFKHNDTYQSNPKNVHLFKDLMESKKTWKMTEDKLLETKRPTRLNRDGIVNPNPILQMSITKGLKEKMRSYYELFFGDESNTESESGKDSESAQSSASASASASENDSPPDEQSDKVQSDQEEEDVKSEQDEKSDDDELEAIPITTKDGRELYLNEETHVVYSMEDEEDGGTEMGELMSVNNKIAPIVHEGGTYIVGKEYDDKYIQCVLSDKLYQKENGVLKYVGHLEKAKNGSTKVVLNKKH